MYCLNSIHFINIFYRFKPAIELSSNLPTNGDTYAAPAFADSIAVHIKMSDIHSNQIS